MDKLEDTHLSCLGGLLMAETKSNSWWTLRWRSYDGETHVMMIWLGDRVHETEDCSLDEDDQLL